MLLQLPPVLYYAFLHLIYSSSIRKGRDPKHSERHPIIEWETIIWLSKTDRNGMKIKRSSKAIDLQEISIRKASPENSNHNVKNISTAQTQTHNNLQHQYISPHSSRNQRNNNVINTSVAQIHYKIPSTIATLN